MTNIEQEFLKACANGDLDLVRELLNNKELDPTIKDYPFFNVEGDLTTDGNDAIIYAAHEGHSDIVSLLLQDSRINPCISNNLPFRIAVNNNHINAASVLLEDDRLNVDDIKANNYPKYFLKQNPRIMETINYVIRQVTINKLLKEIS